MSTTNTMKPVFGRLLAACLSASFGTAAYAQSFDYDAFEDLFGEPVTTSVTGSPQRASAVPANMLIITSEDIRRSGARDIPGVLSRLAGIDVERRSSDHADVAVRGYNQAFTPRLLVLVDGRQVYADYYGFTPWSTVPVELEAIRQIEVVKGPNGALFGFNAVGGVVNIVTRNPLHEPSGSTFTSRVGTHDLEQVSAVTNVRPNDAVALRLSAGVRRSEDFSTDLEPADLGTRRGNERDAFALDANFAVGDKATAGVEATYTAAAQAEMPPLYTLSYTDYEARSLRVHWAAETRLGLFEANAYRNQIEADAYIGADFTPLREFDNEVLVVQAENVFKVGAAHVLRGAIEYRDNSMATTPIGGAEVSYEVVSLTAMWNWQITPNLALTNAVRADDWRLDREGYVPPEATALFGVTNSLWDVERDEISFNTGLVWETPNAGTVRFLAGGARQLPNLLSLGGDFSEFLGFYFLGNPLLEPSKITNYELGWQRMLEGPALDVNVTLFRGATRDVQNNFFGNLGSSATDGVDMSVSGTVADHWRWGASFLAQSIEDDFVMPFGFGPESTYTDFERTTPDRVIKANIGWTSGSWEIDGFMRYRSSTLGLRGPNPGDFVARFMSIPSHTALDARVGYTFDKGLRFSVSGRNLTRSSQRQTSAPEVERQIYATLEFTL